MLRLGGLVERNNNLANDEPRPNRALLAAVGVLFFLFGLAFCFFGFRFMGASWHGIALGVLMAGGLGVGSGLKKRMGVALVLGVLLIPFVLGDAISQEGLSSFGTVFALFGLYNLRRAVR